LKRYLSTRSSRTAWMFMLSGLVPVFANVDNVARIVHVDKPYRIDCKDGLHALEHPPSL
jgi:hypothetical protein